MVVPPGVPGGQLVVALAGNVTLVPLNPALKPREMIEIAKVCDLTAVVIPKWLDTPARPAMRAQDIAVLDAAQAADGSVTLEPMPRAHGPTAALRQARQADVALILRSSGTTGAPKLIAVTHGNLYAMAEKLGSDFWFGLTAEDRAACVLPLYYAAGLKTSLFVPLMLGASVSFPPAGQAFDLAGWVDVLRPTYLSVSPGTLNGIVDRRRASARDFDGRSLRFIMSAAAYLVDDLRRAAESLLGVPVLEFYGLSEAGVMASNPLPPGTIKPGTVGLPSPGELLIVDDHGACVPNGTVGQIIVSGPTVTPGYVVAEEATCGERQEDWLPTGDLGRIDEDGYLTIVGRLKEVINRGGEKVFPYEVEKALLEHPAVLEAAAFGVPHPRLGESVAAATVLKPGSAVSEEELKAFLARNLAGFKVPRRIFFAPSLPRGSTGKIQRSALTEAYAAPSRRQVQAFWLIEHELRLLWERVLGTSDFGIDDDFLDRGGDSLLATEMLLEVEQLTGKPYPRSDLSTLTIRRIAEAVASGQASERSLVTQVKSGSGIPLFFCHGDYFSRGIYAHRLAALLPDDQPVFLLHCELDGLTDATTVEAIARAYLPEVLRIAADSPVVLGGWCNGGLTAWHLAHLLRAKGIEVLELLLIETLSFNARPPLRWLRKLFDTAGNIVPGRAGRFLQRRAMPHVWNRLRSDASFAQQLYRFARKRLSSASRVQVPHRSTSRLGGRVEDGFLAQMISRYVPPRLDVDVTCFIAEEGNHNRTDPNFWRRLAATVNTRGIPGTHLSVVINERQSLAKALTEALQRVAARHAARASQARRATGGRFRQPELQKP